MNHTEFLAQMTAKLPIDHNDLEGEWIRQPGLYAEVGEWSAELRKDAKLAKQHAEFVYSELLLDVHKDENHKNLPKTTEPVVKAWIITQDDYQEAITEAHESDRLANDSLRLLEAMDQRKSALRDLVRLYVHEYYSDQDPKGQSNESPRRRSQGSFEEADTEMMQGRRSRRGRGFQQDTEESELGENRNG